jgi:hypothetical protein
MSDKEPVLRNVHFDEEGRLVIDDEDLAVNLHALLMGRGKLVIRVVPWTCQQFKAIDPKENPTERTILKSEDNPKLNYEYIHWARDTSQIDPDNLPGCGCQDPMELGDLGCGCDIVVNVDCAPPSDE